MCSTARPLFRLLLVKSHIPRPKANIFQDSFFKKLVLRVLEHHAYLKADRTDFFRLSPDILSTQQNCAGSWAQKAIQCLNQRGFARAGMADNPKEFPMVNTDAHMADSIFLKWRSCSVSIS